MVRFYLLKFVCPFAQETLVRNINIVTNHSFSYLVVPFISSQPQGPGANELTSRFELLDFGEFSYCLDFRSSTRLPLLHLVNHAFDYVSLNLVSFISEI